MPSRSIVAGGAAALIAFLALVGGVALIAAQQSADNSSASSSAGILDAAALPAAAQKWVPWIEQAGEICSQITPALLAAQEEVESGFNLNAVSPAGAEGIAQFLPGTWPSWSQPPATTGPDTPFNAPDAIMAEGRFMCALAAQVADLAQSSGADVVSLALAGYNAGSAAVIAAGGIPQNGQTPQYVERTEGLEASFTIVLTAGTGSVGSGTAGLGTPLPCPADAVQVAPGEVPGIQPDTAYCFEGGTYHGFSVAPQSGDRFYGDDHATLEGDGQISAFATNKVSDLVIDGFTITGYASGSDNQVPGVIELQRGTNDTVSDNTIADDRTSGVSWGAELGIPCCDIRNGGINDSTITHNVISNIGYSGTTVSSGTNDTVSYNDVSGTNGDGADHENDVAAIGKFGVDDGMHVVGNYAHDNDDHGVWFDDYNTNSVIENNRVTNSNSSGIFYEISWNAVITGNTVTGNGQGDVNAPGNPGAGISLSSSGSNPGLDGPQSITISDNTVEDNLEGIVLFNGHPNPVQGVTVTRNTISGNDRGSIVDAEPGLNNVTGNNTNGAISTGTVLTSSTGPTAFGVALVEAAATELGVPYSWGGGNDSGPSLGIAQGADTVGFDCSGLVLYAAWKASAGTLQLPHSSEVQATLGQAVAKADIEPGDVIGFALEGGSDVDHIGIYVGDNEMIAAPHTGGVVSIFNLGSTYWQTVPWTIRSYG